MVGIALEERSGGLEPMPRMRKTLDERLDELKQKKQAIEKQLSIVEKRKKQTGRKLDTRRKIIVGGAVLAHAETDPVFCQALQLALQKAVAPKDRPVVMDLMRQGGIQRAANAARAQQGTEQANDEIADAPNAPTPPAFQAPPQSAKPPESARP